MKPKAVVFIDGNNFRYAVRRIGVQADRINYEKFSRALVLPEHFWHSTRYYIGEVKPEGNLAFYDSQQLFFEALKEQKKVNLYLGRVVCHPAKNSAQKLRRQLIQMSKKEALSDGMMEKINQAADIIGADKYAEKDVDVMLAVDMVAMAFQGDYDVAYLLTADSDLSAAVRKVRQLGKKVIIASLSRGRLVRAADDHIPLKKEDFTRYLL